MVEPDVYRNAVFHNFIKLDENNTSMFWGNKSMLFFVRCCGCGLGALPPCGHLVSFYNKLKAAPF